MLALFLEDLGVFLVEPFKEFEILFGTSMFEGLVATLTKGSGLDVGSLWSWYLGEFFPIL